MTRWIKLKKRTVCPLLGKSGTCLQALHDSTPQLMTGFSRCTIPTVSCWINIFCPTKQFYIIITDLEAKTGTKRKPNVANILAMYGRVKEKSLMQKHLKAGSHCHALVLPAQTFLLTSLWRPRCDNPQCLRPVNHETMVLTSILHWQMSLGPVHTLEDDLLHD